MRDRAHFDLRPGGPNVTTFIDGGTTKALCHATVTGKPNFVRLEFRKRDDGTHCERLLSRSLETLYGRQTGSKARTRLENLADEVAKAVIDRLDGTAAGTHATAPKGAEATEGEP